MNQKIDQTILKRYQIISKAGQGAYGYVWKARDKVTFQQVALKKVFDAYRNQIDAQRTYRELMYSRRFDHKNIVSLNAFHAHQWSRDVYLSMEFIEYDLQKIIKDSMFASDIQRYFVFYQLINAIQYLHHVDLVHRDLKPANVLVSPDWQTKICDFGLIRSVKKGQAEKELVMTENIATRWYRAPQILLGSDSYGKPIDIWSLGCIFVETMTGKVIFPGQSVLDQLQKIIAVTGKPDNKTISSITSSQNSLRVLQNICFTQINSLKNIVNKNDQSLINLISRMLEFDPSQRITIQQIKNHAFFQKLRKCLNLQKTSPSKEIKPILIDYDSEKLSTNKYHSLISANADPIQQGKEVKHLERSETLTNFPSRLKKTVRTNQSFEKSLRKYSQLKKNNLTSSTIFLKNNQSRDKSIKKQTNLKCIPSLEQVRLLQQYKSINTKINKDETLQSKEVKIKGEESKINRISYENQAKSLIHGYRFDRRDTRPNISTPIKKQTAQIIFGNHEQQDSSDRQITGLEKVNTSNTLNTMPSMQGYCNQKPNSSGLSFCKIKRIRKISENIEENDEEHKTLKKSHITIVPKKRITNSSSIK